MKQIATFLFVAGALGAQQLPDTPGRAEMERMCKGCHEVARSVSPRLDRDGWNQTMTKMTAYGMKASEVEFQAVLNYLSKNFPAGEVPKVNVNTARAIELESALSLRRSQAAEVIAWRTKNGGFKTFDDLKKVPKMDPAKIDSHRDRILF